MNVQGSFDFDPPIIKPLARATDPDTSWEAANAFTKKRLTEIQQAVLDFFRQVGRATDEQLEDALQDRYTAFSTLRKRRTDIRDLGYIEDSGERVFNRNNRRMIVWQLVEKISG